MKQEDLDMGSLLSTPSTSTSPPRPEPLETSRFPLNVNGNVTLTPGLHPNWVQHTPKSFAFYTHHPVPGADGEFATKEDESWLDVMGLVERDLLWLLEQPHHVFWSFMVYSHAPKLLWSFLKDAPPFYARSQFPDDERMREALDSVEHLVLLTFVRISTKCESDSCYISNLGSVIHGRFVVTVPMLMDICMVYGVRNANVVAKILKNVISASPQYLQDFKEVIPIFTKMLSNAHNLISTSLIVTDGDSREKKISFAIRELYDGTANVRLLLELSPECVRLFRREGIEGDISSFYATTLPAAYGAVSPCDDSAELVELVDKIRRNLLSIMRSIFCSITNDVFNMRWKRDDHANEYLLKMMGILQDTVFLDDYNRAFPIDTDLSLLREAVENLDTESVRYIRDALSSSTSTSQAAEEAESPGVDFEVTGVELDSLISQVKDILSHLGEGFIEACLWHYKFDPEQAIAGILSDKLPLHISILDWKLSRKDLRKTKLAPPKKKAAATTTTTTTTTSVPEAKTEKVKPSVDGDTAELLNDKADLEGLRERYAHLALITDDEYNDEYDDTYDSQEVSIRGLDDADRERRPIVTPRILRSGKDTEEEDEDEDEDEDEGDADEDRGRGDSHAPKPKFEYFVQNPAEVREKQEQRRMDRARREYNGRGKGRGQGHHSDNARRIAGNRNKKKLSARKRNFPLGHS